MPPDSAPIQGLDRHLLNSTLLDFGVSAVGAHQFMRGLPIASQEDRDALRAMFLGLTMAPSTGLRLHSLSIKRPVDKASPEFFNTMPASAGK